MKRKPVIAITADHVMIRDIMPAATAYDVYIDAVIHAADALPWVVPPVAEYLDIDALLDRVDGIVFTGARSNIQPHRYHGEAAPENTVQDPQRDANHPAPDSPGDRCRGPLVVYLPRPAGTQRGPGRHPAPGRSRACRAS